MAQFRKGCACCESIETADGCESCCDGETLPAELQVTIPAGWTDQIECDGCDEMAGDWFVPLDAFEPPGGGCSPFGEVCATWKLEEENWCQADCTPGPGDPPWFRFVIRVELWCNTPVSGECRLEAVVGVERDAADDDPCPRRATQTYRVTLTGVPVDCRFGETTLDKSGGLDGDPDVCDDPPATITLRAS